MKGLSAKSIVVLTVLAFFLLHQKPLFSQMLPSEEALDKRIQRLQETVQHQPKDVGSWHDLAALYREAKRWDEAIEAETKAIEGHPKYAYAYHGRGKAQMGKKDFNAARKDFSKAIELWESSGTGGRDRFFTLEQAKAEHVDSYRTRGMTWGHEGKFDQAVDDLSIAMKLRKNDPALQYERAYLEEKGGRKKEAVADYKRAGLLYADSGYRKKAEECIQKLAELGAQKEAEEVQGLVKKGEEPDNDQ